MIDDLKDDDEKLDIVEKTLLGLELFKMTAENKTDAMMATRAIISTMLLDPEYKEVMTNVYKIMDTTGDGKLSYKELKCGFEKLSPLFKHSKVSNNTDDSFFTEICKNCDLFGV